VPLKFALAVINGRDQCEADFGFPKLEEADIHADILNMWRRNK